MGLIVLANFFKKKAPKRASTAIPIEIAMEAKKVAAVIRGNEIKVLKKPAIKSAGQIRYPRISIEARAIPEGGQRGVTFPGGMDSLWPRMATSV
jgi:hypothetical protein